ncbi:MAG: heavy metal translocating P-type ATPase [Micrococcales bacterium]
MARFLRDYWFLTVSVIALAVGLTAEVNGVHIAAVVAFAVSAIVGLILSIGWLVAAIRQGALGSDVLAAISILATALTAEWVAAAVISLMLASGRALETWAEGRAHAQLGALLARAPRAAHVLAADGSQTTTALSEVQLGSRILVRSGEVVPLDGTLATPGTFDESALTGEPLPVFRAAGEAVASGVVNTDGGVELITSATAANSTYAALVRLVQQAQAESSSAVRIANRWAGWFVPFAVVAAAATWLISGERSAAIAVIVAATPCPLILAVPVAIIAGMSKAAKSGAIIKGGAALEQLARAEVILLDKTGTLTHGGPEISAVAYAPEVDPVWVGELVGSLEQHSPHVVAKALVGHALANGCKLGSATEVREEHGRGLSGTVSGHRVEVGQPEGSLPDWGRLANALLVSVIVDGSVVAIYGLDDPVRAESIQTIRNLKRLGVKRTVMVSGDRSETVASVAAAVGVDDYRAEFHPEQKLQFLREAKESATGTVIAVGDGINDAPALAAADVGVAMGARGATAASEAADVVIVEDSIGHLAIALDIAQGARSRAIQAAGAGMALAVVAMGLSAFGVLSATAAAVSQEFIDASAILWALVPAASRLRGADRG